MQIKTEADAEKAAQRHLKIEAELETREADLKEKVASLKAKYGAKNKALAEEDKEVMLALAEFYWANPESREPGTKLMNLSTVRLSERETTNYMWPRGKAVPDLIKKIKKLGYLQFIRTKEELNKEKVRDEASVDQLRAMGLKPEQEVTVYVEAL